MKELGVSGLFSFFKFSRVVDLGGGVELAGSVGENIRQLGGIGALELSMKKKQSSGIAKSGVGCDEQVTWRL